MYDTNTLMEHASSLHRYCIVLSSDA